MKWEHTFAAFRRCIIVGVALALPAAAIAQGGLVDVLKKKYPVTQTTLDRNQISQPGVVMAIQSNGINAEPWDTLIVFDNPVVGGSVQQRNKFTGFLKSKNMHIMQPGDKVYITKIEGVPGGKGDALKFSILSCDPLDVDGGAAQKRYAATVSFKLPAGGLMQESPDDAQRMIEAVMAPDGGGGGGGAQNPTATETAPPPQAPPPPPQAATQTIAMGQTIDQVVAIMGQPQQIVDLGAKKTYKYKDLKVIFVNGKVSDVQ